MSTRHSRRHAFEPTTDHAIEHPIKHPSTVLVIIPLNTPHNIALSIEAKLGVGGCGFAIAAESIIVR